MEEFVTAAYREQQEELLQLEQKITHEEAREEILDVTKQGFGAFGRMMYEEKTGLAKEKRALGRKKEEEMEEKEAKEKSEKEKKRREVEERRRIAESAAVSVAVKRKHEERPSD